ncbi:hypothetical protein FA10DRAFT_289534 [Acaromyces ingoldii]|uniref:Uncharacterized protein n=1 Tax=Acaromyces ingoldii TaxID=215250 RepID=A0A316YBK4_9BASI|nr:hypothetical protein FA10DRAFT_289534 [Acaromyces ingoldii]PWN86692.1 hypothetical protein FA10DRAFT_289534 [Acaromyces ingoldii]
MHPVDEQLTVVHSVALDILPWPAVRSRVLRAIKAKLLDHDTFKIDIMFGTDAERIVISPFRIHNAPTDDAFRLDDDASFEATMDPGNWECSKTWLEKYWFIVDESIVQRTNYWWEKQGLAPVITFGNPVWPGSHALFSFRSNS